MLKILFVLALLVTSQQVIRANHPQANSNKDGTSAANQPQPQTPTPVVGGTVSQSTAQRPNSPEERSATSDNPKITDWIQALTSALILAVIIVQACIYNKQRNLMRKQWIAMRRGLVQTKQAFYASERAYLAVKTARIDGFRPGEIPEITLIVNNGGRTPAWDIWLRGRAVITNKGMPPEYAPTEQSNTSSMVISVLTSNSDRPIGLKPKGMVVTNVLWSRVETGLQRLFFQGDLCYKDITGSGQCVPVRIVYKPHRDHSFGDYREEESDEDKEQAEIE